MRWTTPSVYKRRTTTRDTELHGVPIGAGQKVTLWEASANRDEREYRQPDEFIFDRPIKRSLAFGRGQHFCIGYHLARLEIDVLLTEWLRRVPDYAIHSDAAKRLPSSFQWGWNNIPVEV